MKLPPKLPPTRMVFAVAALVIAGTPIALSADKQKQENSRARPAAPAAARPIDLNTAPLKTLETAPVIGPELARAIVAARPLATIDDLNRVQGMNAERLEQIRAIATVSAPPPKTKLGEPTSEKKPLGAPETVSESPTGKVDVNRADVHTLAAIPAIGPEVARALVAARPFSSLDELDRVKGLTTEQLEHIRAALMIGAPPRK